METEKGHGWPAPRRRIWIATIMTAVLGGVARPAGAIEAPQAPAVSDGSYTVSYQHCSGCLADWLEERVGDSGTWQLAGTADVTYTNKAEGRYYYRVAYFYLNVDYTSYTDYSSATAVLVAANLTDVEPLSTQLTYRYEARRGDINGDGRTDLYLARTAGGRSGDGAIDRVILTQGTNGGFTTVAPSQTQANLASSWPQAGVGILLKDVNIDGFVDLVLDNVAASLGTAGAANQVVYAPGQASSAPTRGIRSIDSAFAGFASDIGKYLRDPDYFSENAPIVVWSQTYYTSVCSYSGNSYDTLIYGFYYDCYWVPVTTVGAYPDYSVFDASAVAIWTEESAIERNDTSIGEGLDRIGELIDGVTGVGVGGWSGREPLDPAKPIGDAEVRRGIEFFTALLRISEAGAAEPEDSADAARSADIVYVTGRRIIGFLPFHTALEYGGSTISAHDSDDRSLIDGLLVSQVDWGPDRPLLTMTLGTVAASLSPSSYWSRLRAADAGYSDALPYDTIPSIGTGGYNSNGYTHGIILATGGTASIDLNRFVGGERPVPASEYF